MRKMEITGAQVKGFKLNDEGTEGSLTVVTTVYKNKTTKNTLWLYVSLRGNALATYQKNPINGGINLGGTFDVDSYTGKDGKLYPRIKIMADWIEPAKAYGSGLMRVSFVSGRLAEDLRVKENVSYAKMAYNYTTVDKTMWCDLVFWGDMAKRAEAMKLKKGSTIDLDASFDVEINTKDDKQYMNIILNVRDVYYTALPPKSKEEPAPSATPETETSKEQPETSAPNPTPAAQQPISQPAPSTETPVAQETTNETTLSGEPEENDFF